VHRDDWKFELYIIGDNRRSALAVENLRDLCREHLDGRCHVDVYDVKEQPQLLSERKICVAPTLIRKYPLPERTLVGDLSITKNVLEGLGIATPDARGADMKAYATGLHKQNLGFKWHHEPFRR
jgi:circadian clock protein KaiB